MNSPDHASLAGRWTTPVITTYIRFLIPNAKAESINQTGGSTITEFQSQSGADIQLSDNEMFFPGTSDRIIMIKGSLDVVVNATRLVLEKMDELEARAEDGIETDANLRLKVIIPNRSSGAIIGHGGSTINAFKVDSQAGIQMSELDNLHIGVTDRLLTISGSLETQMRAIRLVMSKLSIDSHYSKMVKDPLSYPVTRPCDPDRSYLITIAVADEHVKAVFGGKTIMDISQNTGARIKISDKGDFMAGTSDRKVTMTGGLKEVQLAESRIMEILAVSEETSSVGVFSLA